MPGEAWLSCSCGQRHSGRYGAAGLLLSTGAGEVLLTLRADWIDQGGTWGLPGGALAADESPTAGALREAAEETGIDPTAVTVTGARVDDHGGWAYTTVLAVTADRLAVRADGGETLEAAWFPAGLVPRLPLHPGLAAAWPRAALAAQIG